MVPHYHGLHQAEHLATILTGAMIVIGHQTRYKWNILFIIQHALMWLYNYNSQKRLETHNAFGEYYSTSGGPIRISDLPVSSDIHCVFFACAEKDFEYYPLPSSATVTCSGTL